jgi:hypothetical protein
MAGMRRPARARRLRWLAFLLGLLAGAAVWWFLLHANRRGGPPGVREDRRVKHAGSLRQATPEGPILLSPFPATGRSIGAS